MAKAPKRRPRKYPPARFAAVLLFQHRVDGAARRSPYLAEYTGKRRLCELQIINFKSPFDRAVAEAKRRGKAKEFRNKGHHFEFVGLLDLIELFACDQDEVWYDIVRLLRPMERRKQIVPRVFQGNGAAWYGMGTVNALRMRTTRPPFGRLRSRVGRRPNSA